MAKSKNVILIAVIGLAVLFSGCVAQNQQVDVTEVRNLPDCIVALGTTQSCSIVNLEIRNNDMNSLDATILTNAIVLKNGRVIEKYEHEAGLNSQCVRQTGLQFKVNANSARNVGMCYPLLHKTDNPAFKVAVMLNGERKEATFNLTQRGLTD